MFTGIIQSLLNSSGQQAAVNRARQLSNFVQAQNRPQEFSEGVEFRTFQDVMNSSLDVHTRFDVNKNENISNFGELTSKQVDAKKYDANEIQEAILPIENFFMEAPEESLPITPVITKNDYTNKNQIKEMISKIAKKHGIDEKLVNAVIKQESGYNPKAKSSAGALGLMQLMPSTAKLMGVSDPYNPVQNVEGGVKYLKNMIERYNGNIILGLAAYNAGPGNVDKYDGVPPFKETQNYVKNIMANYL